MSCMYSVDSYKLSQVTLSYAEVRRSSYQSAEPGVRCYSKQIEEKQEMYPAEREENAKLPCTDKMNATSTEISKL